MSEESNHDTNNFSTKFQVGNYEIAINNKKQKNIMDVLDKLLILKENDEMPNDEKNMHVQKIINEYME